MDTIRMSSLLAALRALEQCANARFLSKDEQDRASDNAFDAAMILRDDLIRMGAVSVRDDREQVAA